jgi:uncharacterized protein (DUF1697 family)
MARYAAFLRGVSPMNAKMPELKRCFESAGFTAVKTLLSSGNVVFDAPAGATAAIERKAEAAMKDCLGKAFTAHVRSVKELQAMLDADPFAAFRLPADAKRVVTFWREPLSAKPRLPVSLREAKILAATGREAFSYYVHDPAAKGPAFMVLIEKTFGKNVTTRTWDTVKKCAAA